MIKKLLEFFKNDTFALFIMQFVIVVLFITTLFAIINLSEYFILRDKNIAECQNYSVSECIFDANFKKV